MIKTLKVVSINLFILAIALLLIELILGGWLRKDNKVESLNIIRDQSFSYNCNLYSDSSIIIKYSRDKFGLRGRSSFNQPEKIDILTVGGSTTDQRYINDGNTWQDVIETCYKNDGKKMIISNAGVDGQSTFGHIKSFQIWFPKIPKLKPRYIIFYIGINDFYRIADNSSFDILKESVYKKSIADNSILFNFYRKMRNWRISYVYGIGHEKISFSKYTYTNQPMASKELYDFYDENIIGFKNRISLLVEHSKSLGAEPIFVTQPSMRYKLDSLGTILGVSDTTYVEGMPFNGVDYYHLLNKLNNAIYNICKDKYTYIDLTNAPIWEEKDFYDFYHNTPSGAKKIGSFIYEKIKTK
jgi:hypothetical protein